MSNSLRNLSPPPSAISDTRENKQVNDLLRQREEEGKKFNEGWEKWLSENNELLSDELQLKSAFSEGSFFNAQQYLFGKLKRISFENDRYSQSNWKDLETIFEPIVAKNFRDGLTIAWKYYVPPVKSEYDHGNSIPYVIGLGLSGLEIIFNEEENWFQMFNSQLAEIATRYALHEINGFPKWFNALFVKFPKECMKLIKQEIDWEVKQNNENSYVIEKISYHAPYLYDEISTYLLESTSTNAQKERKLKEVLRIIHQSENVSNDEIATLAKDKIINGNNLDLWFCSLIGAKPNQGILLFKEILDTIEKEGEKIQLFMETITKLLGTKIDVSYFRKEYNQTSYLKDLYDLSRQYIKEEDDIIRVGSGVFTPVLRDNAQYTRDSIYTTLKSIPGKDTFLALNKLAEKETDSQRKTWFLEAAKYRAEEDSEFEAWTIKDVLSFINENEISPRNHNELFELAVNRLLDLKDEFEESDFSEANLYLDHKETTIRNSINNRLRKAANNRYHVTPEDEFADGKKPDLRFYGNNFDAPVPLELKLAQNWTYSDLRYSLENQLCRNYLRDSNSKKGIFLLIKNKVEGKQNWRLANQSVLDFEQLIENLSNQWAEISQNYSDIDEIKVIGIDFTKRFEPT